MSPNAVEVVLVRPSRPANVAAACRAMKNMGLAVLRLVGAPAGLSRPEVRALAYGAWDILDAAHHHDRLIEAVEGSTLVAATSGRPAPEAWTPRRLAEEGGRRAGSGRISLVFGPESTGLNKNELALCHVRVNIPTDPAQPSLNLAHAVLLLAYEIRLSAAVSEEPGGSPRATAGEIEAGLASLKEALLAIGYLNPQNPDAILSELRSLLVRSVPTPRDVSLLRGMARQILWAVRVASVRQEDR